LFLSIVEVKKKNDVPTLKDIDIEECNQSIPDLAFAINRDKVIRNP